MSLILHVKYIMVSVTCNIKHNKILSLMNSVVCVNESYIIYLIDDECMVGKHLLTNNIIVLITNINVIDD